MKRRNTIDSAITEVWPICQYYYTHNNGSCDDILIQHRDTVKRVQRKQSQRKLIHKKSLQEFLHQKRYTYPMRYNKVMDQRRDFPHDFNTRCVPLIARRWSTIRMRKQKRQTLADIITALSSPNSRTLAAGSISKSDDNKDANRRNTLESKWDSIRQYNPHLDNEKIEKEFTEQFGRGSLDEGYSHSPMMESQIPVLEQQQSRNNSAVPIATATNTLLNSSIISIETTNQFLLNSSADQSITATTTGDLSGDLFTILPMQDHSSTIDHSNSSSSSSSSNSSNNSSLSSANSLFLLSMEGRGQQQKEAYNSSTDMFLFLFGFLFLPLWWFGAWRYFMQQDKTLISKQRLSFQILNCCMTLASLLMTGLMIGLVTVWA
jgi:hypothetical protein